MTLILLFCAVTCALVWKNGQLFASLSNSAALSSNGAFATNVNTKVASNDSILALIAQLNSTISKMESRINLLNEESSELKNANQNLQNEVLNLKGNLSLIKDSGMESRINLLNEESSGLKNAIQNLQNEVLNLKGSLSLIKDSGVPVGDIHWFPTNSAPSGYLSLNGMNVSRLIYGNLWNFAQTSGNLAASGSLKSSGQFGPGDGSTTFSLPDLRGLVVRSWDDGKGIDPTRAFGSFQDMAVQSHSHSLSLNSHSHTASTPDHSHTIDVSTSDPGHQHAITYLQYGFGYADFRAGSGGTIVRMNSHSESAVGGGTDVRGTGISVSASARGASTPISVSAESVSGSIGNTGEAETRMKNVALLACIKF